MPAAALPPSLRWLILTDNRIDALPAELGERARLQKLMLAGNRLQRAARTMAACRALELLRIVGQPLRRPAGLAASLPRLSWLACAGNPFDRSAGGAWRLDARMRCRTSTGRAWRWSTKLGEGAVGRDPPGRLAAAATAAQPVAVKLFKGASDQRRLAAQRDGGLHRGGRCTPG